MAVPKFKKSRSNTRSRRSQWKAAVPQLQPCSNRACRQPKPPHVTCPSCGQYSGRQVVAASN
ncbi:50S ribosomal protein L32 [Tamaricihabitans halophyticus]|uniref:50S ribosomal protein L32 n=1 Tax=Tamaricihabitans halophyticus TaxID=1262583 RepID=UPI001049F011|nr:50S ribosomal protein L32 [Tamaricihabitans halophyticus]